MLRFLVEASGCLTSHYLIAAIQQAGHQAIASDIQEEIAARHMADDFILMPSAKDPLLWEKTIELMRSHRIDVVIPTFDDTLTGWSERKELFAAMGIHVMISDHHTIKTCTDKWLTYSHFKNHQLPMPLTSTEQVYPLIKPRLGRGSAGVRVEQNAVAMQGHISQQLLQGREYTVDVLVGINRKPLCIVPRYRASVREGKSIVGVVEISDETSRLVHKVCESFTFKGPVNIQLIDDVTQGLQVIEINPRLGGGSALAFAASTNWIPAMIAIFIDNIEPKIPPVQNGMKMYRYYAEHFVN
ncbi:hypothetical protein A5320_08575 [Rheinheimera sp. SA_1]|uniref:ATP-grasp domain-containing protein n=1 Tax=Rheinheimera sp. SA_1 TaxID=1827365 RepID=UPI000800612C|nr:ATP-grasp domain-containing protein [Rheinheimera sp. SA_1]OBP15403.1 hypothetical protein A5320_08575 [Rheinheimera sp. SA_1]